MYRVDAPEILPVHTDGIPETVDAPITVSSDAPVETEAPIVARLLQLLEATSDQAEKRKIRKQLRGLGHRISVAQ
jgi:hypothetical protein